MKTQRGLIITRFNPIKKLADSILINLIRNSKYSFDIYDGDPVDFATWISDNVDYLGADNHVIVSETFAAPAHQWQAGVLKYYEEHVKDYDFIVSWISDQDSYRAALKIKEKFPEIKWIVFLENQEAPEFSGADVCHNAGLLEVRALASQLNHVSKKDNPFTVLEYSKREYLNHAQTVRVAFSPMRIAKKKLWDKGYDIAQENQKNTNRLYHTLISLADQVFVLPQYCSELEGVTKFTPGFDVHLLKTQVKNSDKNKKIRFTCCGFFDNQTKRLHSLIGALSELKQHDNELHQKIKIDFYGYIGEKDLAEIVKENITDLITIHSLEIPYDQKLSAINDAEWAILIDENTSRRTNYNKNYPLEIIDYIGLQKPILAISQYSGITADIVQESGCGLVVTHSASEIAMYLAKIIYQQFNPVDYHKKVVKKYSSENSAKLLDAAITKIIKKE